MKSTRKGFTLIELVVVTLIMGILASLSMPYYHRTVETSKATDAVAIGHLLSSAYRIFQVDNPNVALNGSITDSCNSGNCVTTPNPGDTSACRLVRCNYVARQDRANPSYTFTLSAGGVSVARSGGAGPYATWGYNFNMIGV
ncbi:MAG: prepilin-type N-terminal cleavage/methylation domain-containing protein, partial [Elusimicrobiota bacterium]|nr:prepilin-type N-terminal cleavage/methylation domain-containing protein [Elusimicrobiota bacterium]